MNFFVNITAPVSSYAVCQNSKLDLSNGNLRGEPRWERNCAASLLAHGHQVYSHPNVWNNGPSNFINRLPSSSENFINISHGSPVSANEIEGASFYFLHFFCSPLDALLKHMKELEQKIGFNKLAITHSFKTSDTHVLFKEFPNTFKPLTFPYVPDVDLAADNFNKKLLLWSGRQLHMEVLDPGRHKQTKQIIEWIAKKMEEDKDLRFAIFSGYTPNDLKFYNINSYEDWMFNFSAFNSIRKFRDRVTIYPQLDWYDCLNVVKEAKLLVHSPQPYGGPTAEAASFGIPSIGQPPIGDQKYENFLIKRAPSNFDQADPLYLYPGKNGKDMIDHLETLFTNSEAYRELGNSLRFQVQKKYTYSAFMKNINDILSEKGII